MKYQRLIQVCAVAVAAILIAGASQFLRPINRDREKMQLSATVEEVKSMPPEIALPTVALAGFRGLAVDYFWMRAEQMKQDGRYYEANQLANWICKLQPRFARVWAFQAWNLAWNISVGTHTAQERWNWVYNGVTLLRDQAIKYNPKAISLYRELGWIFFFKMGDYMDDQHWNYKRRWAAEMHRILGDPPPDIQAEGSGKLELAAILQNQPKGESKLPFQKDKSQQKLEDVVDPSVTRVLEWFRPIAQAPATWEALVADPEMASLVERCNKGGVELRTKALTESPEINASFFDKYQRVLTPTFKQLFEKVAGKQAYAPDEQALLDMMNDPKLRPQVDRLIAFMRRQVLQARYKLDATWMLALMERFGPIDWRVPDAHGMYWTSYGIKQMQDLGVKDVSEFFGPDTTLNTDRVMVFALQRLTNYGRLFFVPNLEQIDSSLINLLPDLRFVAATHKAYLQIGHKYDPKAGQTAGEDLRDGHQNYLRDAIRMFYLYGQKRQAEYYYEYLRTNYKMRDGQVNPDYLLPMHDFVMHQEFTDRLSDPRIATDAMTGLINQALHFLIMGDSDKAAGLIQVANGDIYDNYMKRWQDNPADRMKLPPFERIFNDAVAGYFNMPGGNEDMLGIKAQLWKALGIETQLAVYDDIVTTLREQCTAVGVGDKVDKIFPPPVGLEEYRKTHVPRKAKETAPKEYNIEDLTRQAQEGQQEREQGKQPAAQDDNVKK